MPTPVTRARCYHRRRRAYWLAVSLAVATALIQSLLVLSPKTHLDSDMKGYVERALALVQGTPPTAFERFYPPGNSLFYAAVMGIFGPREISLNVIVLLQAGCLIWSAIVAGRTARLLWRSPRAELFTVAALALFWPLVSLGSFFLSEPLFCALFSTAQWLCVRSLLRPGGRRPQLLLAGFLYSASALVRSQGVLGIAATLLWMICFRSAPKKMVQLLAGALLPLLFLGAFNTLRYGAPSFQIAANDAFNIYLGQSRHAAVSCLNPSDGSYYIFHNNNASEFTTYLPLELLPCEITDRDYFFKRSLELWKRSPTRQLFVSALNFFELFTLRPGWPLVAYEPRFAAADRMFQLLGLLAFVVPASLLLLGALAVPPTLTLRTRMLLGAPLLLFFLTIALSTGQPRYLLPHYYSYIPIASGFWLAASRGIRQLRLSPIATLSVALLVVPTVMLYRRATIALHSEASAEPAERGYALASIRPPLAPKGRFWWFEIQYGGATVFVTPSEGITIETKDFPISRAEQELGRVMRVHAKIKPDGIDLTKQRLRAALYLAEQPRGWGSGLVKVVDGGSERGYPFSDIRGTRWFSFPLAEATSAKNEGGELSDEINASFSFQKLSGGSIQITAIVIYTEQLPLPQ